MSNHIVGVDIDPTAIRAVEAKVSPRGSVEVRAYHEVALPEGAVNNGQVVEPSTVATVLKRMWSDAKFGTKNVVLGIGDQKVIARDLVLPRLTPGALRELLPTRVQEFIPMPVGEAILDFYPVAEAPATSEGPAVRGLLVAAYADAVTANVAAVERAGLHVVGVDFLPFALHRAVGLASAGLSAIVDVSATATNVVISVGGVPDFVRVIPMGSEDAVRALLAKRELPRDQAARLAFAQGVAAEVVPPNDAESAAVTRESHRELLTSIVNTLRYYSSTHGNAQVRSLVLTGHAPSIREFPEAIVASTGVVLETPAPFARVRMPRALRQMGGAEALRASMAIGLAMGARA
jgi:type IV pilus assembly protein PilM